ncbi:MAG: DDE-type integrase/transposase/recombinase [Desulfobulbaceae bacterium]|nr:DDE-type integrase/transposase/recombinase [Desulfobulbaceae bacterium]
MNKTHQSKLQSWAQLRFSIVGGLLASPPEPGELGRQIQQLAIKRYKHPCKDESIIFGASTIERWYYKALNGNDPFGALIRKLRSDSGSKTALPEQMMLELGKQYCNFPHWSYQLHADNLQALIQEKPELGKSPSYSSVRRRMKERGWYKKKSPRNKTKGQQKAETHLEQMEVRSYESSYVHALWHLDFHKGKTRITDSKGEWHTPIALCILDDCSRLCCHIQWYRQETAEVLQHGLFQAFMKRGLPRSLMTDNGAAMISGEITNGLLGLSIKHDRTLPYSPYQNGKQESFWGQLEGRLMSMLSRVEPLTLETLNYTTQAWSEMEYNRKEHHEINCSPVDKMLKGSDSSRPALDSEKMSFAFTKQESRVQRKSDGTLQIKGVRFEVPSRFRHFDRLHVRYQSWNLGHAWLVDEKDSTLLAGKRRLRKCIPWTRSKIVRE